MNTLEILLLILVILITIINIVLLIVKLPGPQGPKGDPADINIITINGNVMVLVKSSKLLSIPEKKKLYDELYEIFEVPIVIMQDYLELTFLREEDKR